MGLCSSGLGGERAASLSFVALTKPFASDRCNTGGNCRENRAAARGVSWLGEQEALGTALLQVM